MNESEMMQDDEISLFDLWEKLREGWLAVVGGTVLGIAGAVLAIFLIPPKYESSVTLEIGKVAGAVIEAPDVVVQRVRQPAFLISVAESAADAQWLRRLQVNASSDRTVTPSIVKGTPLVSIVVAGETPDQSEKRVTLVIDRLKLSHEEIRMPLIRKIEADIEVSKEKLKSAELEFAELAKASAGGAGGAGGAALRDVQFAPVALVASLRVQKQAEVFGLRQQLIAAENSLLPPTTTLTRPLEAAFAAERPVSPKRALLLALGSIGGLLAGVLWVFLSDAWRRARASREGG